MKILNNLFLITCVSLVPILACYTVHTDKTTQINYESRKSPKKYEWNQVLPFGNGSHQDEWRSGTYPMGLKPLIAFEGILRMTGQKASWSSSDGITWTHHPKKDWGERISMAYTFFDNKIWMYGGMRYQERQLINEVWYSKNGVHWEQADDAAWQPRKGHSVVAFQGKLWLFGGVSKVSNDFESLEMKNDIWSSVDGLHWIEEVEQAPWSPRDSPAIVSLRDTLYMLGGQGLGDVWRSIDGKSWMQLTPQADWKKRYDKGTALFDGKLWVFGGRDMNPNHNLAAQNDVWYSPNGIDWTRQAEHAPWTVRSGVNNVVFKDKLWLYSGKHTGGNPVWKGDVWALRPY